MRHNDEYKAVFRNLRTERTTERYAPIHDPWWLAWVGGIVMGCVLALMMYWGV